MRFGASKSHALPGIPASSQLSSATRTAIPSCGFAPLQGLLPKVRPDVSRRRAPLLGFPYRLAHPFRRSPHTPRRPTVRVTVRVQGFSPSSRFAPPSASRVCFTPQTPFGFSLQGFPLSGSRAGSSPSPCRHAVAPEAALPPPRTTGPRAHHAMPLGGPAGAFGRLHGFAPPESPCRRRERLTPAAGRAPPGFFPLQGLPHPVRCSGSSPPLLPCAWAAVRSAEFPRRSGRLPRYEVSLAPVVAWPLSRLPSPPEVFGHRFLTMQRRGSWLIVSPRAPGGVTAPRNPLRTSPAPTGAREASVWPARVFRTARRRRNYQSRSAAQRARFGCVSAVQRNSQIGVSS